jgi:hypothetical protein
LQFAANPDTAKFMPLLQLPRDKFCCRRLKELILPSRIFHLESPRRIHFLLIEAKTSAEVNPRELRKTLGEYKHLEAYRHVRPVTGVFTTIGARRAFLLQTLAAGKNQTAISNQTSASSHF